MAQQQWPNESVCGDSSCLPEYLAVLADGCVCHFFELPWSMLTAMGMLLSNADSAHTHTRKRGNRRRGGDMHTLCHSKEVLQCISHSCLPLCVQLSSTFTRLAAMFFSKSHVWVNQAACNAEDTYKREEHFQINMANMLSTVITGTTSAQHSLRHTSIS